MSISWAENEVKLACKRENPDWDGKSFDYGCAIYQNALECYKVCAPLIDKAGHSGFSYSLFVNVLTKLLKNQILVPITEEDFEETFPKESQLADYIREDGTIVRQCVRYPAVFRNIHPDGTVTYKDIDRVSVIDQHNASWNNGWVERLCKDLIPPITLPYIPTNTPIKIYTWEFIYNPNNDDVYIERGSYNTVYIHKIVFPNGEVKEVNRCYSEEDNNKEIEIKVTKKLYQKIKKVIEEDDKDFRSSLD